MKAREGGGAVVEPTGEEVRAAVATVAEVAVERAAVRSASEVRRRLHGQDRRNHCFPACALAPLCIRVRKRPTR